jgi:hypothetical protein
MKRTITIWAVCFVALIAWSGLAFAQTAKPAAMKTIKLPSGEEVFDISGEWDVVVENYGPSISSGSYPQIWKITQEGSYFAAIRMIDDPWNKKGSESIRGELDKSGIKKATIMARSGPIDAKGQISDDGNKIIVDDGYKARVTATRK